MNKAMKAVSARTKTSPATTFYQLVKTLTRATSTAFAQPDSRPRIKRLVLINHS
jgi:hypothetical protein